LFEEHELLCSGREKTAFPRNIKEFSSGQQLRGKT